MKEHYEAPRAEKLEFDYTDVVAASNGNKAVYNDDPNGQYYKCSTAGYYAPGWGKNC